MYLVTIKILQVDRGQNYKNFPLRILQYMSLQMCLLLWIFRMKYFDNINLAMIKVYACTKNSLYILLI